MLIEYGTNYKRTGLQSKISQQQRTRQCRPDLSYAVSQGQGTATKGTIRGMRKVNQAHAFRDKCIYYAADAISWDTALVVSVTDASFANETVVTPGGVDNHTEHKRRL